MKTSLFRLILCLIIAAACAPSYAVSPEEIKELLQDFSGFNANPGAYHGSVTLLEESATPLAVGKDSRVMAAAGEWEQGRALVFGHTSYADSQSEFFQKNPELIKKLACWLTHQTDINQVTFLTPYNREVGNLKRLGLKAEQFNMKKLDGENKKGYLFIVYATQIPERDIARIQNFIRNGGALWIACTPWAQMNADKPRDFIANKLLLPIGIQFSSVGVDVPNSAFAFPPEFSPYINRAAALKALNSGKMETLSRKDFQTINNTLIAAAVSNFDLSKQWKDFAYYNQLLAEKHQEISAGKMKLSINDLAALRLMVGWLNLKAIENFTQPENVPEIASAYFPGAPDASAPVITKTVAVNPAVPDWTSTGLYAAPGAVITVKVPDEIVRNGAYKIRIGCHRDQLWHLEQWRRYPQISFTALLNSSTVSVKSAFGGLVYIEVPYGAGAAAEPLQVEISGAVEAPLYVLGKTTNEEWNRMKKLGVPWGELASSKLILSVSQDVFQTVDNPEAVMRHWDAILDADADFVSSPRERIRPERMICDEQISAGFMHSGYPVMTPMGTRFGLVSGKGDNWGFYHELGHNHQRGEWTFDGAVEVTVNLFTLYCFETVDNNPQDVPGGRMNPDYCKRLWEKYSSRGAKWEEWKQDPFLGLAMYIELKQRYGWDAIIKTIAQYNDLSNGSRPHNDQEKRDQFLVRMSQSVNENLTPFFEKWGMPVTQEAKDAVKNLPEMK